MLSPDETMLYVVNTQGASVSAFFFNAATGVLSGGCTSSTVSGQSADWSYLTSAGLASQTGNGGGVYVAEYGSPSGIALVSLTVTGQTPLASRITVGQPADHEVRRSRPQVLLAAGLAHHEHDHGRLGRRSRATNVSACAEPSASAHRPRRRPAVVPRPPADGRLETARPTAKRSGVSPSRRLNAVDRASRCGPGRRASRSRKGAHS